ncbi:MAG: sulfite exporter TauE/SafE family protein [Deltaproteobacteria bacterium]|nr:sulfite exporter TauE/SafE family protein [Deltaproteobacteria bacterium]
MKSFSVNQLFRKAILSCCFITILLIPGTDLPFAHDVQTESMGHHIYVRLSSRFVAIDYTLIQTELADTHEILAMNSDCDSSITEEEKDRFFRNKASNLFNHLNITLNNTPLDFELISMFCSHAQTKTFYYKADIPNGIKRPYELIARSGFPCSEDENFLYYIQTMDSVRVLNMDLSGAALPVKGRALHDPPVLKVNFNTGICDKGTGYKEPVLVSRALAGEEQKTSSGQIPFEPVSDIEKLKKIILSEKAGCQIILIAIIMAIIYGGLHALTPGHGKTLVAAYLIGTQGRIADAVILGIVTTFTHTFSVIILGLITLFASKYILPQQLLPFLQLFSGLLIVGIGTWLIVKRIISPTGFETHGGKHVHTVPDGKKYYHSHEHTLHDTDRHKHPYNHDDTPSHPNPHSHDHAHTHHNDETRESGVETGKKKTSLATLISLGFSGGMVPCPDALILLLLAIAINRIIFGLFILVAFSFGLAFVLITIGILMVTAQPFLERFSGSNILRVLPALSCSIIIGIGLFMVIRAVLVLI